jgi:hypothetical protein
MFSPDQAHYDFMKRIWACTLHIQRKGATLAELQEQEFRKIWRRWFGDALDYRLIPYVSAYPEQQALLPGRRTDDSRTHQDL